jgi:hypothetical protein
MLGQVQHQLEDLVGARCVRQDDFAVRRRSLVSHTTSLGMPQSKGLPDGP